MYDPHTAVYHAMHGAGKPDERWNKRFLSMLNLLGYDLIPDDGRVFFVQELACPRAPAPVATSDAYPTPSLVVPSTLKARLQCPDE
jgi:hypothetical protein